ncbi:LysR family transcriptional regulator [Thalassotalea sp. M1531]|uniref:LysR family transcriptional regulator n=1 Tax=Thalassotalea algicola TaxID=2716224 RepID=A0A7Y0LAK6_9GAMM|nr:LysR family transcriptional regulator [Thalassotalea algicola]NMP30802.1 LysR family transcriptional regulator [Thalassotalea algicola]
MIDLNDLMIYKTVVDSGSFTAAARQLSVPKSNVSRRIKRLEDSLNVCLLERTTRTIAMTDEGELYYQHCLRIHEELAYIAPTSEQLEGVITGRIRICSPVGIGQEFLAYHLAEFRRQYTHLSLDVVLTKQMEDIVEKEFDIVIRHGTSNSSDISSIRLIDIELQLFASKQYLANAPDINRPEDLANHSCLVFGDSANNSFWQLISKNSSYKLQLKPSMQVNDYFVLKTMAEQDLGIALLPDYLIDPNGSDLVRVLPEVNGGILPLNLEFRKSSATAPKIKALKSYLKNNLVG